MISFSILALTCMLSAVMTYLIRIFALKKGFVDIPSKRKIHNEPIALGGGVAIYASMAIVVLVGLIGWRLKLFPLERMFQFYELPLSLLSGMVSVIPKVVVVVISISVIFLLGLLDDIKGVRVGIKIVTEALMGVFLYAADIKITLFIANPLLNLLFTVGWVVLVTNSFNLLDNMDGLTAGIAFISGIFLLGVAIEDGQFFVSFIIASFCGALLGFLFFNYYPAKIFMGDAGSLSIGYVISVLTILTTYYKSSDSKILPIMIPLFILMIPIFDTLSVVVIRFKQHRPIFQGDKSHFSHRLVSLGLSQKNAVLLIYLLCICLALPALLVRRVDPIGMFFLFLLDLVLIIIIVILEYAAIKKNKN